MAKKRPVRVLVKVRRKRVDIIGYGRSSRGTPYILQTGHEDLKDSSPEERQRAVAAGITSLLSSE